MSGSTTRSDPLGFAAAVLERGGALVEAAGPGGAPLARLQAVLPPSLQQALELAELAELGEGGASCGYETPLLGRLAALALGQGRVLAARVLVPEPSHRLPGCYAVLNGTQQLLAVSPRPHWTLVGFARSTGSGDDRREGTVQAAVLAPEGQPVPLPPFAGLPWLAEEGPDLPADELGPAAVRLLAELQRQAVFEFAGFRGSMSGRLQRDLARVDRFFAQQEADLRRRLARKGEAPSLEQKLASLPAERERRRALLLANATLRVAVQPFALVALSAPGLVAELELHRRKQKRVLLVRYDGLARSWIELLCDGCGAATFSFALCDETRHLLCPSCWQTCGSGGHRPCFRCAGLPPRQREPRFVLEVADPSTVSADGATAARRGSARSVPEAVEDTARTLSVSGKPRTADRRAADLAGDGGSSTRETSRIVRGEQPPAPSGPDQLPLDPTLAPEDQALQRRIAEILHGSGAPLTSAELRQQLPRTTASWLRRLLGGLFDAQLVEQSGEARGTRYRWTGGSPNAGAGTR